MKRPIFAAFVFAFASACQETNPVGDMRSEVDQLQDLIDASCNFFVETTDLLALISRAGETTNRLATRVCDQVAERSESLDAELARAEAEYQALLDQTQQAQEAYEAARQAACDVDPDSDACNAFREPTVLPPPPAIGTTVNIDGIELTGFYGGG